MNRKRFKFWLGVVVFFGIYAMARSLLGSILVTIVYSFLYDEYYLSA